MDPITAFSLACGVIQVVDFGLQVLSTARELYQDSDTKNHDQLNDGCIDFSSAMAKLQDEIRVAAPGPLSADDQVLFDLSQKCSQTAIALEDELNKLRVTTVGVRRIVQATAKAIRSVCKSEKVKELEISLEAYRRALDTRVLLSLRARHDVNALKQDARFASLDASVQRLVNELANNRTAFIDIVRREASDMRAHESKLIQQLHTDLLTEAESKKFLEGIAFPQMTTRQEEVADVHEGTCRWIFEPPDNSTVPWTNFREWLETGSGIYWISGHAGAGKSCLMTCIVEDDKTKEYLEIWAAPDIKASCF